MKVSKLMDMGRGHAHDAFDMAKDYLPSSHELAKKKMKTHAKLAKGATKAMPEKVKRMELAKLILLPVAGMLAGLLLAPKSGKETRTDIKHKFTNMKDISMEKEKEWMEKEQEWLEKGKEKVQDMKDKHADRADESSYHSHESEPLSGNVHGTAAEPHEDQTIPADKLDETLSDLGYDSEEELIKEDKSFD